VGFLRGTFLSLRRLGGATVKTLLKLVGGVLLLLVLLGAGGYLWATSTSARILAVTVDTHRIDLPVPFPLSAEAIEARDLPEEEAREVALTEAIERGRHLVNSRYVCSECHGGDFSGGVMIDAPIIGRLLGPNITTGQGSRTLEYTMADWDRIVRHGVLPNGRRAVMPSEDFMLMSDQELSDVIAYIRSFPPVDHEVPAPTLGPLGKVLLATGELSLSADHVPSHMATHALLPPAPEVGVEFGRHIAAVCTGCHGMTLVGGPIAGGDPSWAPASNLTSHETGLAGWSFSDFERVMREGVRPGGVPLVAPMTMVIPYTSNMTPTEMEALWVYLQSVPPAPTP